MKCFLGKLPFNRERLAFMVLMRMILVLCCLIRASNISIIWEISSPGGKSQFSMLTLKGTELPT